MSLMSLKDYAKKNNVTYEAVRQQVVRYAEELGNHLIKDGRQQFLDEEAVIFLDSKRQKNPVSIIQTNKDEEIEALRREKEELLIKIAVQADNIAELAQWKAEHALAIAEAGQKQLLLEERTKKVEQLENVVKKTEDMLHLEKQRADQLQRQLDIKNKSFFQRLFKR